MADVWNVTTKVMDTTVTKCTCGFKGYKNHKGADLIPKSTAETPDILAYDDGVVMATGNVSGTNKSNGIAGCGTYVAIRHAGNIITRYQHMKYNSLKVKVGDKVKKGDVLGKYGRPQTTGYSTGCHLHFDISLPSKPKQSYVYGTFYGESRYYVDPKPYLCKTKTTYATKTTTAPLNVRKGAGTGYARIKTLPKGTKVTIYGTSGNWSRISKTEQQWVCNTYLR